MIQLPLNSSWSQTNTSDKFGSIAYSKNMVFDEKGYAVLSPRSVNIFDDSGNVANSSDSQFDIPIAFGRYDAGQMRIATTNEPFNLDVSDTGKTIAEDGGASNPNLVFTSHGKWWQNRFHESTDTAVSYNSNGTWTANAITGLSSGKRHYMEVFASRAEFCVTDGNVLREYDTSYAPTNTLTIPTDYEMIGLAYNNSRMAVITRLGSDSAGQNADARFYVWDGASTGAISDTNIAAYAAVAVRAYKSSFIVLTCVGEVLYWNGGGFDELARFPFRESEYQWGDLLNFFAYGDNFLVDGDLIHVNVGFDFEGVGKKREEFLQNNPSGIWTYDPSVGLYHRYSPSNSKAYFHSIAQADVNTTTDIITTSVTIPATGNPMIMTQGLGGIKQGQVYFVIRLTSTTFKIAETKQAAIDGNWVDITSADTNNYFWLYDIIDYGATYATRAGAIALWGTNRLSYRDVIFGGDIIDTSGSTQATLCTTVPFLEARGYIVTPRIFTGNVKENLNKLYIKHSTLDTLDSIIVKEKHKEFVGIPTSSPNIATSDELTWTSSTTATTNTDLSEVKAAFDAGENMELELIAGLGAGQMTKVTGITFLAGTYTITTEDEIVGYVSGYKSHFVIDNWKFCAAVDIDTQRDGIFEVPIGESGKSPQLKIELRGYQTTIEDIIIPNTPQQLP